MLEFIDSFRKINLRLKGSDRIFNLRVVNDDDYLVWKRKIEHSVSHSNGRQKDLSIDDYHEDVENSFKFWRFMRISEEAYLQ